jgi:hypothetical protein
MQLQDIAVGTKSGQDHLRELHATLPAGQSLVHVHERSRLWLSSLRQQTSTIPINHTQEGIRHGRKPAGQAEGEQRDGMWRQEKGA